VPDDAQQQRKTALPPLDGVAYVVESRSESDDEPAQFADGPHLGDAAESLPVHMWGSPSDVLR